MPFSLIFSGSCSKLSLQTVICASFDDAGKLLSLAQTDWLQCASSLSPFVN